MQEIRGDVVGDSVQVRSEVVALERTVYQCQAQGEVLLTDSNESETEDSKVPPTFERQLSRKSVSGMGSS